MSNSKNGDLVAETHEERVIRANLPSLSARVALDFLAGTLGLRVVGGRDPVRRVEEARPHGKPGEMEVEAVGDQPSGKGEGAG